MTSYFPFNPNPNAVFQFQPTLDANIRTILVTWNLAGQRYYINIYDLDGVRITTLPLIGSPIDYEINLVAGYFDSSTLVYRESTRVFEVNP